MKLVPATLRLHDLAPRNRPPMKLVNVRVPITVVEGVERVARQTGYSKTDATIALLNEGLDEFERRRLELVPNGRRPAGRMQRVASGGKAKKKRSRGG